VFGTVGTGICRSVSCCYIEGVCVLEKVVAGIVLAF